MKRHGSPNLLKDFLPFFAHREFFGALCGKPGPCAYAYLCWPLCRFLNASASMAELRRRLAGLGTNINQGWRDGYPIDRSIRAIWGVPGRSAPQALHACWGPCCIAEPCTTHCLTNACPMHIGVACQICLPKWVRTQFFALRLGVGKHWHSANGGPGPGHAPGGHQQPPAGEPRLV